MRAALAALVLALAGVTPAAAQTGPGVIAYTRDADGPAGPAEPVIHVAAADGSGERVYATGSAPALARDSTDVAYAVRRGGARQLVIGRLDAPGARQVTALPDREGEFGPGRHGVTGAVWSPGATWLALRLMEGSTTTLAFVRPDGSGFLRMEFGHLLGSGIVWRDDESVAVGTDTGLHLVTVDGKVSDPPGRVNGDTPVAWLDAIRLVVNDAAGITELDTVTGERRPILAGAVALAYGKAGLLYALGDRVGILDPAVATSEVGEPVPGQPLAGVVRGDGALVEVAGGTGEGGVYAFPGLKLLVTGDDLTLSDAAALDAVVPAALPAGATASPGSPAAAPPPTSPAATGEPVAVSPEADSRDRGRSTFTRALPAADEVSTESSTLLTNLLLTALLMLLITFPAELFNSTLEEHYDEVRGWFRLKPRGERPPPSRVRRLAVFAAYTAVAAVLYGLLDPGFGLDAASARLVLGLALGMVVVTLAFSAAPLAYARRRYAERGALRVLPGTLAVAVACVAISRLASFEPGYLYGIVGGFAFARAFSTDEQGRNAFVGAAGVLGVSIVAWLLWQPVNDAASDGTPGLLLGLADSTLATVAIGGLEGLVIGLLPLRSLQGYALSRWRRPVWVAAYGVVLFAFVHLLLRPGGEDAPASFVTWLALFLGFGAASVAFWGYFRFRAPRPSSG